MNMHIPNQRQLMPVPAPIDTVTPHLHQAYGKHPHAKVFFFDVHGEPCVKATFGLDGKGRITAISAEVWSTVKFADMPPAGQQLHQRLPALIARAVKGCSIKVETLKIFIGQQTFWVDAASLRS